jgi:hypothetical protein
VFYKIWIFRVKAFSRVSVLVPIDNKYELKEMLTILREKILQIFPVAILKVADQVDQETKSS